MDCSLSDMLITISAILTAGGVMFRGMYLASKLFVYKIERDTYKKLYEELRDRNNLSASK